MQTTDKRLRTGGLWMVDIPDAPDRLDPNDRAAFEAEEVFTIPVWPRDGRSEPVPVLTAVPFYGVRTADDFRPRIRAFVETAVPIAQERDTGNRPRALLGIPPIGFGRGGANLRKGDVIRMLLDEARTLAAEFGVDIAIALRDDAKAYALAQHLRKTQGVDAWPELNSAEMEHARRLGTLALSGRLVPFMGAGVSVSAGAPSWPDHAQLRPAL